MPGMTGIELLLKIKEEYPGTQVIIMTSHGTMDSAVGALKAGAYDFLSKPFDGQALPTG